MGLEAVVVLVLAVVLLLVLVLVALELVELELVELEAAVEVPLVTRRSGPGGVFSVPILKRKEKEKTSELKVLLKWCGC